MEHKIQHIINTLSTHRRLLDDPGAPDTCQTEARQYMAEQITHEQPIEMILPAFPCKSASHWKTLGQLPDTAEELSLQALDTMCRTMQSVHQPGVRLTICSDGRVFSPHINVSDEVIHSYNDELKAMIQRLGLSALSVVGLEDLLSGTNDELRTKLLQQHAKPLDELREQTLADASMTSTLRGIMRFMHEEVTAWDDQQGITRSRRQTQKQAKELAWLVLQGSQAWGGLLDERFPDALRLSIHPQSPASSKWGIHMLPTRDNYLTPWHGVAVQTQGEFRLMHRRDAEALGGEVVWRNGRPRHFVITDPEN